jgi:hypothetical protein
MGTSVSGVVALGKPFCLTSVFIAALSWQPPSGRVMIATAHARRLYVLTDVQVLREEAEWTVGVSELRAQAGLHVVGAHRGS